MFETISLESLATGIRRETPIPGLAAIAGLALSFLCGQAAWSQVETGALPVAAAPTKAVIVKCDYANRPYQYLDPKGVPTGFDVELLRAAAREAGLDVVITVGSWEEVKNDLYAGRVDVVPGVGLTDAEKSKTDLTTSYLAVENAIFAVRGSPVRLLDDLAGRSIIVRRGDTVHEYLKSRGLVDNIVAVETTQEALDLLARGRHDCAVLPKLVGTYFAKQRKMSNIEVVGQTSIRVDYCFAVRKDAGDLLAKLNDGLSKVISSGEHNRIYGEWLGVYEKPPAVSLDELVRYAELFGGGFLLPVVVLGSWLLARRRKRKTKFKIEEMEREIWESKKTRTQLEEQKQSLVSLLKNAPHGVAVLNGAEKDAEVAYINEAATRITGYEMRDSENLRQLLEKAFPDTEYRERLRQRWQGARLTLDATPASAASA